jgi:hypothetical protein
MQCRFLSRQVLRYGLSVPNKKFAISTRESVKRSVRQNASLPVRILFDIRQFVDKCLEVQSSVSLIKHQLGLLYRQAERDSKNQSLQIISYDIVIQTLY